MPEKHVTETTCGARHRGIGRLWKGVFALIGIFFVTATWAIVIGNGAQRAIDVHIGQDEKGDEGIQQTLEGIETRQIRMGERIDGIYERLGE